MNSITVTAQRFAAHVSAGILVVSLVLGAFPGALFAVTDSSDTQNAAEIATSTQTEPVVDPVEPITQDEVLLVSDSPEEGPTATIIAHKIVCTDEADLPNFGKDGGPDITYTTASDWVATHESCSLQEGWEFQWSSNWNDDGGDSHTGRLGTPWNTFGPTGTDGAAAVSIPLSQVGGDGGVWVREVLRNGYLPFTYNSDMTNGNNVSAEMYCHTDATNYDNLDQVQNISASNTYNCVAWNHQVEIVETGTISVIAWDDTNGDGVRDEGEAVRSDVVICAVDTASEDTEADTSCVITDENGVYSFIADAGYEYLIIQDVETPRVETSPVDGYCVIEVAADETYVCDFGSRVASDGNSTTTVTNNGGGGKSNGSRRRSNPTPQVLGESTSTCNMYLFDYMRMGQQNNTEQVTKLQTFLIGQGYTEVVANGIFDDATDKAVRNFQLKYQDEVLTPWMAAGITATNRPTGWVYQLTRWKINNIVCPGSEALPTLKS
jgi:hypothetical protein